jgi:hypothetical protein
VQQLLQAPFASTPTIEFLQRLHALSHMSILPIARHAFRQAIELLLHQQTDAAISAVAMT